MLYPVRWFLSLLSSALRFGAGRGGVEPVTNGPMPVLYEFEACPFCRVAREAISEAGLAVHVRPCPKNGTRFRPMVSELGGKAQFPYLVDLNPGEGLYESADIARTLRKRFSSRRPLVHWLGPLNIMLAQYAGLIRLMGGWSATPSKPNARPLVLHGAENSPAARLVRDRLCVMELDYIWHPGSGSGVRLSDPNIGADFAGATEALAHLSATYKAAS